MRFWFIIFSVLYVLLGPSFAHAVHDRELDNVYRDRLVIPPELRPADGIDDDCAGEGMGELKMTRADEDFLSMFDVG